MSKTVDSYRFISGITKRMIKNWISMKKPRHVYSWHNKVIELEKIF